MGEGKIKITSEIDCASQLGFYSVDLRLNNTFRIFNHAQVPYNKKKGAKYAGQEGPQEKGKLSF